MDCLNKFNPCLDSGHNEYALNYGYNYCNQYENNLQKLSKEGQQWVGKVRKCLQDALKDEVGTNITCSDLKTKAFKSHTKCYAECGFCALPVADYYQIMNLVKGAFVPLSGSSWLSFFNGVATAGKCLSTDARWQKVYLAVIASIGTGIVG